MDIAFWNDGKPRPIKAGRVVMPNGDVVFNAKPDPENDIYEVKTVNPVAPLGKKLGARTVTKRGSVITIKYALVDIDISVAKDKMHAEIAERCRTSSLGGLMFEGKYIPTGTEDMAMAAIKGGPVAAAMKAHLDECSVIATNHHAAVNALRTTKTVLNYDIDTNWPTITEA